MEQPSTKRSIAISFATQYVELGIQFLSVLVLARLLSPDDIGTYSVAAFLMTLLHVFRDFGVVQYLIQERELSREKIQAAIGVAIILAQAVALTLLASSGAVARFYGKPEIERILYVMAASFAISPFGSLLIGILRREFRLMTIFYIKTFSALCHVTVAVTLALHGFGPISLAWANFAGILSFGIAANIMRPPGIPWRPRFRNIRTVLSYGGIASLGNAANIAGTNSPDLVIGKVMDMAAVGYFSRGNGLVQLFTRLISGALMPLVLPWFAQQRREGRDLVAPYLQAVAQITALAWPFFAALAILSLPMIRALYGKQWDASVPIAQLLCASGAIAAVSLFATQVMVANGEMRSATYSNLLTQPFRVLLVLLTAVHGLLAVAGALVAAELLSLCILSTFLHRSVKVGPMALLRACAGSAMITACSAIGPFVVMRNWQFDPGHPWPPLAAGIASAAVGWLASLLLSGHPLGEHLLQLLRPLLRAANVKDAP